MTFGQSLRACRQAADLSLRELARRCKISAAYLSDMELGRRFPSGRVHDRLMSALDDYAGGLRPIPRCPKCGRRNCCGAI